MCRCRFSRFLLRCASTATDDPNALDWFCSASLQQRALPLLDTKLGRKSSAENGHVTALRVTLRPPFVVENLLPLPLQARWQCRQSASVLRESEVPVGDKLAICDTRNPHAVVLGAHDEKLDPPLPWKRRGLGALVLSVLLPGFKWSEDAVIVQPQDPKKRRRGQFATKVARDCADHTDAIDLYQRLLKVIFFDFFFLTDSICNCIFL